ncbi:MAG: ABC transporter permease [Burkholderiaceae bacterium]
MSGAASSGTDYEYRAMTRTFVNRHWLKSNWVLLIAICFLAVLVVSALIAPHLLATDPLAMNPSQRLKPPSSAHWFGTDGYGRDVFARTIYGGRVSLLVGISVAVLASVAGAVIGILAGYLSLLDRFIMRVMDGIMSIPGIVLAVALMALFRASVMTVVIAIMIPEIPRVARLVRSMVLTIREQEYIQAAIVSGSGLSRILLRHVLPNTAGPLAVQATFVCASAILLEAYLSFLGVGLPQDVPTWGNIMSAGRTSVQIAFWSIFYPGIVLALAILSINVIGDSIRDIYDPRARS